MILRKTYSNKLIASKNTEVIQVITGIEYKNIIDFLLEE